MKEFLKEIGRLFFLIVVLMGVLDIIYTNIYRKSVPRNKVQYALSLENKTYDYIFLGSSRVENNIITSEVKRRTNKSVVNLGFQQVKLKDVLLFLKILVENNVKTDKLFIQVDYNYNILNGSDIIKSQTLPYIRSSSFVKAYLKDNDSDYWYNYYIPFYRYAVNDYKIGFREFFSSAIGKKPVVNFENGFVPLQGQMNPQGSGELPNELFDNNPAFSDIRKICQAKNINVVFFCAPFCANMKGRGYIEELKERIPNLVDFSEAILETKYYIDCGHLNSEGALKFTNILIEELDL